MKRINKVQLLLLILAFASLGAIVSPIIFFILPTIIFGKKIGLYLFSLLPVCSFVGVVLGASIGIIITIYKVERCKSE